jgi:hypothetical protein
VLPSKPGAIDYRASLSLDAGVRVKRAAHGRETLLSNGRGRALVLPLSLGEWRADGGPGELACEGQAIQLCQYSSAGRMLAALWFDFDSRRTARPFTWRRLTVAENRAAVPDHVAVGYRIQAGSAQWLVYRSLAERGNRTLLAHNLSTEMLVGRFTKAGEVEKLIEIE